MNKVTPSVAEVLKKTSGIGDLMPLVERHIALQQDLAKLLAASAIQVDTTSTCHVLRLEKGTLTLAVRNTLSASKLRQTLPRVQAGLAQRGWQVNTIQVRVQPTAFLPQPATPTKKRALSASGFDALNNLLQQLPASAPLSLLHTTLTRFIKHHQE